MAYRTRPEMFQADFAAGQSPFQSTGDISLASGLVDQILLLKGDFLYIDQASTGSVYVELNAKQGGTLAPVLLAAGGSIEMPDGGFDSIKLNASAQLNKSVRIIVGNGARIKGGANVNNQSFVVTAVDGAKVRVDNDRSFTSYAFCAAVAAQYSHLQVINPVGNTKTVYVEKIKVLQGVTQTIGICSYSTALSTAMPSPINKRIGDAVGTAQIRKQNNAAALYTDYLSLLQTTASSSDTWQPIGPYCLPPGKGIVVLSQSLNTDVGVIFEMFEE